MTIPARIAAASCLPVLLIALGSADASWTSRPPAGPGLAGNLSVESPSPIVGKAEDPAGETPFLDGFVGGRLASWWYNDRYPRWTITHEAVLLQRSAAQPLDLLFSPLPVFNTADLEFGHEVGPRISLIRRLGRDWGLEANYLGIDGWSSSAVRGGDPLILYPPGVLVSTQFTVDYDSRLYSAEVNSRYYSKDWLTLLAGYRRVELQEDFRVVGLGMPPRNLIPRYDTHGANYMNGFQVGTDARLFDRGGLLRLDGLLKAGVYANHAHQETFRIGNLGILRAAGDRRDHTAFLGELGLTALFRLGEHLSLRGGCQVIWIEGVVLAPDQISHTDVTLFNPGSATLNTSGSVLYHGFHVGLEARW